MTEDFKMHTVKDQMRVHCNGNDREIFVSFNILR